VQRTGPLLVLLAVLVSPACIPVVTHEPRVSPGTTAGGVISAATHPTLEGEVRTGHSTVTPVVAPLTVFMRRGWMPEDTTLGVPFSAGISFPVVLPFSVTHPELDLYAQLTPVAHPTTAAGAGVLLSRTHAAPYVQAGIETNGGRTLYTTQAVARFHGGGRAPDATVWMPSVAAKASRFHLFVQAGLGRERLAPDSARAVRFLMGGLVVEAPSLPRLPGY
jgi:hypothetical protein